MRRNKPIKCDPERDMKPILDQLGVTWPEFLEFARKEFKRMLREIVFCSDRNETNAP